MGKIITAILLSLCLTVSSFAQDQVVIGEYQQGFVKNGEVYTLTGSDALWTMTKTSLSKIKQGDGAQYKTIYLDSTGRVFVLNGQSTTVTEYSLTTTNDSLKPDRVQGFWRSYFATKNGEIWYLPLLEDEMQKNGNATSTKWIKLNSPSGGSPVKKIVSGASIGFGLAYLIALCEDGTVWEYRRGSADPVQLTWSGGNSNAIDVAQIGFYATVIITADKVFTRGYYASVVGGSILTQDASFTEVTSFFALAPRPWKKVVTTYTSLHIIDANSEMWSAGNNMQGIMGTGDQYPSWRFYWYDGTRRPYQWSLANGDRLKPLTKVAGAKVTDIITHNTVTFYVYAQDEAGNWYAWGRDKGGALARNMRMRIDDEAALSEFLNNPAPRNVYPLAQTPFAALPAVDSTAARLPIANAGMNQYPAKGVNEITLYGDGTHQQQYLQGETITYSYAWTKISGPDCATKDMDSKNPTISNMVAGTYIFRNTVTNNKGGSDYDEVEVTIQAGEDPPPTPPCNCIISDLIITN